MDLVLTSRLFTWNKTDGNGLFTASAAVLEKAMDSIEGWIPYAGYRLQYRHGEWGFYMKSHRTGRKLWFKRVKEHRSEERELLWVDFASESPDLQLRVLQH